MESDSSDRAFEEEHNLNTHERATEAICAIRREVDRQAAERICLLEALHDAIWAPSGVVPRSAIAFYDPQLYSERSDEQ